MTRLLVAVLFSSSLGASGGVSVVGSKHDLSVTGPGPVRAASERQICVFCHIPHGGGELLSSRPEGAGGGSRPYESTTAQGRPKGVTGVSRRCLSCHDGTVAVGETRRQRIKVSGPGAGKLAGTLASNLGTDLRRSHPISLEMAPASKGRARRQGTTIVLDAGGLVQCTSCHDPHAEFAGAPEGRFLRDTVRGSSLCAQCHDANRGASHALSSASFGAAQGNLDGFKSVADAGCRACHRSHGADVRGRLLARTDTEPQDDLCLRCHASAVTRVDIGRDLSKPHSHRHDNDTHDASEGPTNPTHRLPETSGTTPRHAACVDCHDPHAADSRSASAPAVSGSLFGTWGIGVSGGAVNPAVNQYEICFKCHGDSANQPQPSQLATVFAPPRRAAGDVDLRRVFSPDAPSNHPVVSAHADADAPSLLSAWTPASVVYCTDCHASDSGPGAGGAGARGPHGSIYAHLLERNYSTGDNTMESPTAYALCYKCHDRAILFSANSAFPSHRRHVVDEHAPCSVCHSAHGVSRQYGTPSHNAHLVDFDLSVVKPIGGAPLYTSYGRRSGTCTLICHSPSPTSSKGRHDAHPY